jgi:hypothetical protein
MQVKLKQDLWNGSYDLKLDLPDDWSVNVLHMGGSGKRALREGQYRECLAPLSRLLKRKKEICILFDDLSRPTRASLIVPYLLELFDRCGIRDEQVRFICALGTHAPHDNVALAKKLGREVLARFAVYNHNPYENCDYLGKTKLGTPVLVNKEYLACDVRIGIGSFLPHSFCGFGGGYKIVMPAVSHIDAIEHHHGTLLGKYREAAWAIGKSTGNPLLEDLKEYGRIVRLDAKIDVMVNAKAEHVDIYAGEPDGLYTYLEPRAYLHYGTTFAKKADIVFANSYSKANEGVITLSLSEQLLKDEGGSIVILGDVAGGQVVHYLLGRFGKQTWGRLAMGERRNEKKIRRIFIYSRHPDKTNEWWFGKAGTIHWSNNVEEIIGLLAEEYRGKTPEVHVIPDGTVQMPLRMQQ